MSFPPLDPPMQMLELNDANAVHSVNVWFGFRCKSIHMHVFLPIRLNMINVSQLDFFFRRLLKN